MYYIFINYLIFIIQKKYYYKLSLIYLGNIYLLYNFYICLQKIQHLIE